MNILKYFAIAVALGLTLFAGSCSKENDGFPDVPSIDHMDLSNHTFTETAIVIHHNYSDELMDSFKYAMYITKSDSLENYDIKTSLSEGSKLTLKFIPKEFEIPSTDSDSFGSLEMPPVFPGMDNLEIEFDYKSNHNDTIKLLSTKLIDAGAYSFSADGYITDENKCIVNINNFSYKMPLSLAKIYSDNFLSIQWTQPEENAAETLKYISLPISIKWDLPSDALPKDFGFTPEQGLTVFLVSQIKWDKTEKPSYSASIADNLTSYFDGIRFMPDGSLLFCTSLPDKEYPNIRVNWYQKFYLDTFRYQPTGNDSFKLFVMPPLLYAYDMEFKYNFSGISLGSSFLNSVNSNSFKSKWGNVLKSFAPYLYNGLEMKLNHEGPIISLSYADPNISQSILKKNINDLFSKENIKDGYRNMFEENNITEKNIGKLLEFFDLLPELFEKYGWPSFSYSIRARKNIYTFTQSFYYDNFSDNYKNYIDAYNE